MASRLSPMDVITGIGDCRVRNYNDYEICFVQAMQHLGNNSVGYCVDISYLERNGISYCPSCQSVTVELNSCFSKRLQNSSETTGCCGPPSWICVHDL